MIASTNPVSRLVATVLIAASLILTIDWVSAGVALVLEVLLFACSGIRRSRIVRRTVPLLVAAILAATTIVLYGRTSGRTYAEFVLARISDGSIDLAAATLLRILAIGLPAVVLFVTVDPTDLADGLVQLLRLPSRFVIGALAAFRMLDLFVDDWRSLTLARRARGVADRARVRRFAGQAFALLVLSIRRGSALATAMEARGFGGATERTWARESSLGRADALLIFFVVLIGATAVTVSVVTGNWRFIGA